MVFSYYIFDKTRLIDEEKSKLLKVRIRYYSYSLVAECTVQSAEYRVQITECRIQSAEYRVQSTE